MLRAQECLPETGCNNRRRQNITPNQQIVNNVTSSLKSQLNGTLITPVYLFTARLMKSTINLYGWLCGTVVEHRSSAGKLSQSCARPAAYGWPLMWINCPLQVNEPIIRAFISCRTTVTKVRFARTSCHYGWLFAAYSAADSQCL